MWVKAINEWASSQVADWIARPKWEVSPTAETMMAWRHRGGADLMAYTTVGTFMPSVVYGRWLERNAMPKAYPNELVQYLQRHGVKRVIVGHTPHGNCPTIIPHDGLSVIMADTSFSGMGSNIAYRGDNRGDAVAEVVVDDGRCSIKGRIGHLHQSDFGETFDYEVPPHRRESLVGALGPPQFEGKRFFVKAKLTPQEASSKYLLSSVDGFVHEYQTVDEEFLKTHFITETIPGMQS